ncbi:uncharacterized protein [Centruroides vittatus]
MKPKSRKKVTLTHSSHKHSLMNLLIRTSDNNNSSYIVEIVIKLASS